MTGKPLLVVLHGANLDLLGERPAAQYGNITLAQLEEAVMTRAAARGWECLCLQTNHEGHFIEYLHDHRHADALLVNPGAWTHYSYAIHDALEIVSCLIAEVHLSDIDTREEWRRLSVVSPMATFTIKGKGLEGYLEAVDRLTGAASGAPSAAEAE